MRMNKNGRSFNIQTAVEFDESVAHYEIHAHQPYTSSAFNNSDEIRISIQHQDLCLLPSHNSLHVCERLTKTDGSVVERTKLVNNAISHLLEEIRYKINAIEIDRCKNIGLSSFMRGLVSLNPCRNWIMENAGWLNVKKTLNMCNDDGYFDVSIPLSMIVGFTKDYRQIVVNTKHELTRSRIQATVPIPTSDVFFKNVCMMLLRYYGLHQEKMARTFQIQRS